MKYKIIEDHVIQALVDLLDDIQLDAAEQNDLILLGFVQDMITELINSEEVFDNEEEALDQLRSSKNKEILKEDYYESNDKPKKPSKFDKDELKKLYRYFDNFLDELSDINPDVNKDKPKKSKPNKNKKNKDGENDTVSNEPNIDTNEDKFNKYYSDREYKRQYSESKSLIKMLTDLGIDILDKN